MIISRVSSVKKGKVLLYLDGEAAIRVDKETFLLSPFKEGTEISDEELLDLIKSSDYRIAKERALYLLGLKNYSKNQLCRKLCELVSRETAEEICDKMEELRLLDDRNYAQICVRDMINIKKFGVSRIRTELYKRGIDRDIIDEVLCDIDTDNSENITEILEKKYPMWDEDEKIRRKAFAFLQRRGYSYSEINSVMRNSSYD